MDGPTTEGARVLSDLTRAYGFGWTEIATAAGVSEATVRKYASGRATRPNPRHLTAIAKVFGSRDGTKILYAFGMDALAQQLAKRDLDPITPTEEIEELPNPVRDEFDERLTRLEEAVNRILEELVGANNAMPG